MIAILNRGPEIRAFWSIFFGYLRLGIMEGYAYRLYSVNQLLAYPILLFANYYLFGALYPDEARIVAGFTRPQLLGYISIVWLLRSAFPTRAGREMAQRIRSGDITTDLMKPLPLFGSQLARNIGYSVIPLVAVSTPLALLAYLGGGLTFLAPPGRLAAFAASALLAYLLLYACNYVIGVSGFLMDYNPSLMWLFDLLLQLMGGLTVPLAFFPPWLSRPLSLLPFRDIYATPTRIYLGQLAEDLIFPSLLRQAAWVVVIFATGCLLFRTGLKRLQINGG